MWPFNKPSEKKSFSSPLGVAILFEDNISDTGSFQFRTLAREGYLRNATVYAAINEIATAVSGLDWQVVDFTTLEPLPDSAMARLLRHPNDKQKSFRTFIQAQMAYKLIDGNSFITADGMTVGMESGGALAGKPGELNIHMPDKVEVKDEDGDVIKYRFHTRKGGGAVDIPPERVWHSMVFNPLNQFRGVSPMVAGSLDWKSNNESKRWNFSMLSRGGRPSGILSVKNSLDPETRQRMTEEFNNKWGGANNAGKVFILEDTDGGTTWQETSVTPKDADWIEGMKHSEKNIAKVYQVPPELIGDSESKTYASYQEARKSFYTETVIPHAEIEQDEINSWLPELFGVDGKEKLIFDKNKIEAIQEDVQKRREEMRNGYTVGLVKPNEYRKVSGLEELDDAENIRVMPLNLAPASTLEDRTDVNENDSGTE